MVASSEGAGAWHPLTLLWMPCASLAWDRCVRLSVMALTFAHDESELHPVRGLDEVLDLAVLQVHFLQLVYVLVIQQHKFKQFSY